MSANFFSDIDSGTSGGLKSERPDIFAGQEIFNATQPGHVHYPPTTMTLPQVNQIEFTIVSLTVSPSGTYSDQHLRPYDINPSNDALTSIAERVAVDKRAGIKLAPNLFYGVGGDIARVSATPVSPIAIPNGWGTERLRFMLIAQVVISGATSKLYIQGYTDYPGYNLSSGSLDDAKMEFIVNSITRTRVVRYSDPLRGNYDVETIMSKTNVYADGEYEGQFGLNGADRHLSLLRPEDVFMLAQTEAITSNIGNYGFQRNVVVNSVDHSCKFSSRSNGAPMQYLSRLVDAYTSAAQDNAGAPDSTIYNQARNAIDELTPTQEVFLRLLRSKTGRNVYKNTFTLQELRTIDLTFNGSGDQRVTFVKIAPPVNLPSDISKPPPVHHAGQTAAWNDQSIETWAMASVTPPLTDIMSDYLLNVLWFSTDARLGRPETRIEYYQGYSSIDISAYYDQIITRIHREIIEVITQNYQIQCTLRVRCNLLGDNWIYLSFNGEPEVCRVSLAAADALTSPVLTRGTLGVDNITSKIGSLVHAVTEGLSGPHPVYVAPRMQQPY